MKAAATLVALSLAVGQEPIQRFRSGVDVVTVDALVTQGDRPVTGLRTTDFELRDNGVIQEIDMVSVDEAPVSMLLVLDTSNSVEGPTLRQLKEAALAAVSALTADDRAAVLTFADRVSLRADWGSPSPATRDAIAAVTAGGSTSLYDAGYAALTFQDELPGRRSFVVLFSDAGDTSSWLPARAVVERARRTDAVVYVVTPRKPQPDVRLEYRSGIDLWHAGSAGPAMLEVATLTGGHVFIAERGDRLRDIFSDIVMQFRSRYFLSYRPRGVNAAGWHSIDLRLKGRKATINARRGYSR